MPRNQSEEYGHSRRFYAPQNQSHKKDEKEKESNIYHPKENDDVNGSADTVKKYQIVKVIISLFQIGKSIGRRSRRRGDRG